MSRRNSIRVQFDVATDDQAAELRAAWEEIVSGKRARIETAAVELDETMERARTALQKLVKAIEEDPGSGQARRLVRLLAGLYNGSDCSFDLNELRGLDADLASACIDYLNYDRLAKAEVHTHLPGGSRQMQRFIADQEIRPQPRFSQREAHESRSAALTARLTRNSDALLHEAVEDLLLRYESKPFGALLATQQSAEAERPLVHTHRLSESTVKPFCGATDGPRSARGFEFSRMTCRECRPRMLHPEDGSV